MRYVLGAVLAASTIMASPLSSMAATGVPYSSGSSGFDVSYPQCGSSLPNGLKGGKTLSNS